MPVFGDSENKIILVQPGDYVFCVVGFEAKICSKGKNTGADMFELKLEIEPNGPTVYENLIDSPSLAWKFDTFLKSAGVKLAKGEAWDFRKSQSEMQGAKWVNPFGLRGWCKLGVEEYPAGSGKQKNRVQVFYTDKQKLEPRIIEEDDENTPF